VLAKVVKCFSKNLLLRYKEVERARQVWQRFLHIHDEPVHWMRYAKFETKFGSPSNARQVYERAIEYFGEDNLQESILLAFARFEEQQKEVRLCQREVRC
jgi:crooked neck